MTSPVRIVARRTFGAMKSAYTTAFAFAGFFAAAGAIFAFALEAAEGSAESLAAVWTASVSPALPVLAAVLAMDVWSEERRSGRIALLLSAPVRERELVIGKFLGVWSACVLGLVLFHVSSMSFLAFFAPGLLEHVSPTSFLPGFLALAMQAALWSAVSLAASAATGSAAVSLLVSLFLTAALPRAAWHAVLAWSAQGRQSLGSMPLDAHAVDIACGLVSSATVLSYVALTAFALFVNSKFVASVRLVGRGARSLRMSTCVAVLSALALCVSSIALFYRLDTTLDLPVGASGERRFSARTHSVLSEVRGEIAVTAFMSRKDARFRSTAHFLRALSREADSIGGVKLTVRYVDPRWDLGSAERLVRSGVPTDSIVFERGRLRVVAPLADGFGERTCASAIVRLGMPPQRRVVYWTQGHGEASFDSYGDFGFSDIARELVRDGYRNKPIELPDNSQIPSDCALIVVAGATHDFSRAELGHLDAYLRSGGRLLVLLGSAESGGLASVLSGWGIKTSDSAIAKAPTLSGTDVVVSDFSDHPVSGPLSGSQIVLEHPVSFVASAAASESGAGVDRISYSELARVAGHCVAAASERGAGAGDDVALRPTRIIAVGDASFALNGQLEARANANRDFFLNCVAYLSGSAAVGEAGTLAERLVSGLDRDGRARLLVFSSVVYPSAVFAALALLVMFGRRRA